MNPNDSLGDPNEDPRIRFAGERTLLAWIRTGLAMMGLGFVVARFGLFLREMSAAAHTTLSPTLRLSVWIGVVLIILGIVVNVMAGSQHLRFLRRLNQREPYQPTKWSGGVVVAMVLAVIGLAMVAYLVFLP